MRCELSRIEPLRAANVSALVYGLLMTVFAIIFLPFVLLFAIFAPGSEAGAGGAFMLVFMLLVYPILGVVMGWLSGLLGAAIYNVVRRWSGGLLFELEASGGAPLAAQLSSSLSLR